MDYRASPPYFSGNQALGPDGALWISDFGLNRLIRHDFTDNSEKAWTLFDPDAVHPRRVGHEVRRERLPLADRAVGQPGGPIRHQHRGAALLDRLQPAPPLRSLRRERLRHRADGRQRRASPSWIRASRPTRSRRSRRWTSPWRRSRGRTARSAIPSSPPSPSRRSTHLSHPTDLTADVTVPGFLFITWAKPNAYGLVVDGGGFWAGSDGFLVHLIPQTFGGPTDLTVPIALQAGSPPADSVRVDLTLYNKGSTAMSGTAYFQYSPGAYPYSVGFNVPAGGTTVLPDAFLGAATFTGISLGSVRFQVTTGQATDLYASARSVRVVANGGSFGLSLPAQAASERSASGRRASSSRGRVTETSRRSASSRRPAERRRSTSSPPTARCAARRRSTSRATCSRRTTRRPRSSVSDAETGDVLRVTVTAGVLQPWILVQDGITRDVAISLPVNPTADAVIPNVSSIPIGSRLWTSGLQIFNPGARQLGDRRGDLLSDGRRSRPPPRSRSRRRDPPPSTTSSRSSSRRLRARAPLVLTSNVPVAISFRNTARNLGDGSEYACQSPAVDGAASVGSRRGDGDRRRGNGHPPHAPAPLQPRRRGDRHDPRHRRLRRAARSDFRAGRRQRRLAGQLRARRTRRARHDHGGHDSHRGLRRDAAVRPDRRRGRGHGRHGPRQRPLNAEADAVSDASSSAAAATRLRTVVRGSGIYPAEGVVTNERLSRLMDTTDEWITQRTGIRERRFARKGTSSADLGVEAARRALDDAGLGPADIDLIVFATMTPAHYFPGNGGLLAARLGLATTHALDIRMQCAGFLSGLQVADAFIRSGTCAARAARRRRVPCGVLPVDRRRLGDPLRRLGRAAVRPRRYAWGTAHRDRAVIFGDGAGAFVLEAHEAGRRARIPRVRDAHRRQRTGTSSTSRAAARPASPTSRPRCSRTTGTIPIVEGRQVFRLATTAMPQIVARDARAPRARARRT